MNAFWMTLDKLGIKLACKESLKWLRKCGNTLAQHAAFIRRVELIRITAPPWPSFSPKSWATFCRQRSLLLNKKCVCTREFHHAKVSLL